VPRPNRWDDILAASAIVFREKGYDAASLEEIAERVGMWKGSLYHYISSKHELLLAVVEPIADTLLDEVRLLSTNTEMSASAKLLRLSEVHSEVIEHNFNYVAVYLQEIAGRNRSKEWDRRDHEYLELISAIIAEGVKAGEFAPDLDPSLASHAFLGGLNWMTRWYKPRRGSSPQALARTMTEIMLNGMVTRET
jgi:AcrR family transcriptional regulator